MPAGPAGGYPGEAERPKGIRRASSGTGGISAGGWPRSPASFPPHSSAARLSLAPHASHPDQQRSALKPTYKTNFKGAKPLLHVARE